MLTVYCIQETQFCLTHKLCEVRGVCESILLNIYSLCYWQHLPEANPYYCMNIFNQAYCSVDSCLHSNYDRTCPQRCVYIVMFLRCICNYMLICSIPINNLFYVTLILCIRFISGPCIQCFIISGTSINLSISVLGGNLFQVNNELNIYYFTTKCSVLYKFRRPICRMFASPQPN